MFMTCLTISSGKGTLLDQSCKASILEYRSSLLRILETLAFLPALLVGLSAQKQEIHIDFFDKFELDAHNPGETLTLEIQSKQLEVSDVTLDIYADLRGEICMGIFPYCKHHMSFRRVEIADVSASLDLHGDWYRNQHPPAQLHHHDVLV